MGGKSQSKGTRTTHPRRRPQASAPGILGGGRKRVLAVLFIPSVERDGVTPIDQEFWVNLALDFAIREFAEDAT
jgi:hypothetical protein